MRIYKIKNKHYIKFTEIIVEASNIFNEVPFGDLIKN